MAQISLSELIKVLKAHPLYKEKWEMGVPAEQALYIILEGATNEVDSENFIATDGNEIVLDKTPDGRVCGIEIT